MMGGLVILHTAGVLLDSREVTNAGVWLKPLKFSLSIGIYSLTLAWLIGRLPSGARATIAHIAGTISAAGLAIELVVIDGFALIGESSHFNLSTPFHAAMWHLMAASIAVVWVMTFVVAALLFRAPLGDAARRLDVQAGTVIALAGMALAFLVTGPKAGQSNHSSSCSCSNCIPGSNRHCRTPLGVCGSFCWLRPIDRCAHRDHPDRSDHPDRRGRPRRHRDHENVVRLATRPASAGTHRPLAEDSDMTASGSTRTITDRRNPMKTYKVVTLRGGWFKETASANLEATLNKHASEGWRVVNSFWLTGSSSITTVLERDAD